MSTAVTSEAQTIYERVYIWELPVRLTHWLIVLSIGVLTFTGIYIGNPFMTTSGEAGQHFMMGNMKAIHFYAATVFTLSVLVRLFWMFRGNYFASWHQFLPVEKKRYSGLLGTLKFYLMIRTQPPHYKGHNPLAGLAYSVVFLLYVVMIATGLGMYGASAHASSWMSWFAPFLGLFGGPQGARWLHHVAMWLLLGFFAHHVWSAILVARVEKSGILDSIFTGYKYLKKDD